MQKNEQDTFEVKHSQLSNTNFFLSKKNSVELFDNQNITEPSRRLNDYDFNLLQEDAYKDVNDDLFKLEYKISKLENELKSVDSQIESAKEIQDYNLTEELNERKKILQDDLESLVVIYNNKSLSTKISGKILNLFGNKAKNAFFNLNKKTSNVSKAILSKLPKQFSSIFELRKSLSKLENLNKSVDELITMNIPYGENYNKYEQLSKYIIKANSIQTEISKYINK